MKILREQIINESRVLSQDGIFWVIGDKFIQSSFDVNPHNEFITIDSGYYTHKELWNIIKNDYKVNSTTVDYDYYPRGRVVIQYKNGKFKAIIYMDNCLRPDWETTVIDNFNLNLPNCEIEFAGNSGFGDSHYTCNKCRKVV